MSDNLAVPTTSLNLLWDCRDSRLAQRGELALMLTLITRSNPEKKYSCYPSYKNLSDDTGYDERTLRNYMRSLEKKSLLRREFRGRASNMVFINASLIRQVAARNRAVAEEIVSPFDPPVEVLPELVQPEPSQPKPGGAYHYSLTRDLDDLFFLVSQVLWPTHTSATNSEKHKALRINLNACVALAAGYGRCGELFQVVKNYLPDEFRRVANSEHLGAYLRSRVPQWLETCDLAEPEEELA